MTHPDFDPQNFHWKMSPKNIGKVSTNVPDSTPTFCLRNFLLLENGPQQTSYHLFIKKWLTFIQQKWQKWTPTSCFTQFYFYLKDPCSNKYKEQSGPLTLFVQKWLNSTRVKIRTPSGIYFLKWASGWSKNLRHDPPVFTWATNFVRKSCNSKDLLLTYVKRAIGPPAFVYQTCVC